MKVLTNMEEKKIKIKGKYKHESIPLFWHAESGTSLDSSIVMSPKFGYESFWSQWRTDTNDRGIRHALE